MAQDPTYITPPQFADADGMQTDAFDYLRSNWPDWSPADADLITWQVAVHARMTAETAEVGSVVPDDIFAYMGTLIGVPRIEATSATVGSTWTFTDNPAGRTIPAGTLVALDSADGGSTAFQVVNEITIATPALTTAAGEVVLRAMEAGEDGNDMGGVGVAASTYDPITWVGTVTLTGISAGGSDEEAMADYLSRLSRRLTLLTPRPILPRDYSLLARDLAAQNGANVRVLAIDGYNPGDSSYNNERMIFLVLMDAVTGDDVPAPIKTLVDDALQEMREVNFVVNVGDPDRNTVDVSFSITPAFGADPAEALDLAESAVTEYLNPIVWGIPAGPDVEGWIQTDKLRRQDISTVINNVPEVDHWDTLTIGINGGGLATTETFNLVGAAPVVEVGTVTGALT